MKIYRIIYYSFLLFVLLVHQNNAQINAVVDTTNPGEIVNLSPQNEYSLQFMKFMALKDNFVLADTYKYNEYAFILPDDNQSKMNLAGINKSLKLAWVHDYKMRTRYDLGKVGAYLGMSKEAFAVILAIISL